MNDGTLVNVINYQGIDRKVNNITISSNNNFFLNIDPDVQLSQHCAHQQCKYYDSKLFNSKFSGTNHISMIHTNIRSSKKNLRDFLCNIENLKIKFNFIVLTETWENSDNTSLNVIEGYTHVHDTRQKRIGGDVSIYIDVKIPFKRPLELKLDNNYFESFFIEVVKSAFQYRYNVIIAAIYKPPNVNVSIFNKNLDLILSVIEKEKKYVYLLGDFNINTLDETHTKSTLVQDFINIMSSYSYCKLISMPTRVIKNSATLIDNVYCNLPNIYDTGHRGVLNSIRTTDHMPIFTVQPLLSPSIIEGESFKIKKNFGNQNISKLKKTARKHNWSEVFSAESAQLAFTVFFKFIKLSFSECCPIEKN